MRGISYDPYRKLNERKAKELSVLRVFSDVMAGVDNKLPATDIDPEGLEWLKDHSKNKDELSKLSIKEFLVLAEKELAGGGGPLASLARIDAYPASALEQLQQQQEQAAAAKPEGSAEPGGGPLGAMGPLPPNQGFSPTGPTFTLREPVVPSAALDQVKVWRASVRKLLGARYCQLLRDECKFFPDDLSVADYADAIQRFLNGSNEDRLRAQFQLYDRSEGRTGLLKEEDVEQAVNGLVLVSRETAEQVFAQLGALDKKQKKPFPKRTNIYIKDEMYLAQKLRMVFACTDSERLQRWDEKYGRTNPAFPVTVDVEEYSTAVKQHFPEYTSLCQAIADDYYHFRRQFYDDKKERKFVYMCGAVFMFFVGVLDAAVQMI